jgi:hypothetical protein
LGAGDSGIQWLTVPGERSGAMGLREARVAKNEAVARDLNEQIEQAQTRDASSLGSIICECGYSSCELFIAVKKDEYNRVRDDPRQFFVLREHVIPDVELIVEERDRFAIVSKRQGTPAKVATRTDPRG